MKLNCAVLVVYRTDLMSNFTRRRAHSSSLSLMLNPKDNSDAFLIHQTLKNNGVKYKITGNVEAVFTKFLSSGKATIRLKVPAIDICIECDSIQLKCFLQKLKAILMGKDPKDLKLMTVSSSTTVPQKTQLKLVITKKDNYDLLCQFPRTLQTVQINNIMFSSVDSRILKLCNLKVLNLEKNSIEYLPEEIGRLQIQELYLSSNNLGCQPYSFYWKWTSNNTIQSSLALLSLESNKLQCIPDGVMKLKKLVTLKLDDNLLNQLPVSIGRMSKLSYLTVSSNRISCLPSTLRSLHLKYLDISHNQFSQMNPVFERHSPKDFFKHLSLREWAGLAVMFNRLHRFVGDGEIPVTVEQFLSETSECHCQYPTFTTMPVGYVHFSSRSSFVNIVNSNPEQTVMAEINFCSYKCYQRFAGIVLLPE